MNVTTIPVETRRRVFLDSGSRLVSPIRQVYMQEQMVYVGSRNVINYTGDATILILMSISAAQLHNITVIS